MIYLVCMYGSGLSMCASHTHFKDEDDLNNYLKENLELDSESIEELLDGNCIEDPDGEAFYYLINEVISDNC